MEKQRINRITAVYNDEDGVTLSLYRTHNKVAELTNKEIGVPSFSESKTTNKPVYMLYCKETLINLLEHDGIEEYYYDPKNESEQSKSGMPKKFNSADFVKWAKDTVINTIKDCLGEEISVVVIDKEYEPNITENYKDGSIKYGTINIDVTLEGHTISVPAEIRSGQFCKPRKVIVDDDQKNLNTTTLKLIIKPKEDKKEAGNSNNSNPYHVTKVPRESIVSDYVKDMTDGK